MFLDAFRALLDGRFDGRNERAWLFTSATRKALDRRRLGWGRFVRGSLERLFPEYFRPHVEDGARRRPGGALRPVHRRAGEAALTAPARTAQPERVCALEAERAAVAAAVRRLRPSHRAVLWLREWQALDYDQISRVLGISRASTKAMLWRARARFREEWLRQEAPA